METTIEKPIEEKATPGSGERLIQRVKRATRKRVSAEDKIRIVLEGFRKEISVAELCRRESVHVQVYYKWMKDFMEAGKARMKGDMLRNATDDEVKMLKKEVTDLKEAMGSQALQVYLLKKSLTG